MSFTYAYLREDGSPYYIGKGSRKDRVYAKHRSCPVPKDRNRILILKDNLTEQEAIKHEIYLISIFGRKDLGTGILLNRTNGGDGTLGHYWSEERKQSHSNKLKGKPKPPRSEEHRERLSLRNKGKKHTEEWKKNASERMLKTNPFRNKSHTEEIKEKLREMKKGMRWWNNGQSTKMSVECPGDGWKPGRK